MKITFLGLPDHPKARVALIPVPFEQTTTWLKGTSQAPLEILKVSPYLEFFDEETLLCPHKELGFHTYPIEEYPLDLKEALSKIERKTQSALESQFLPIFLGGEHTISFGSVMTLKQYYPSIRVLHLDAHLDFRREYLGSTLNHATVMRHLHEQGISIMSVGIRALSEEEYQDLQVDGPRVIFAKDLHENFGVALDQIKAFASDWPVYLSLDMDALDPSIAPGVGTPEPGGLNWQQLLEILKLISMGNIVGMDIVETRPLPGYPFTEFLVGKIILKFASYLAKASK